MAVIVLDGPDGLRGAAGRHLGRSVWLRIDADRLALFAAATGDPQARYLALALTNQFLPEVVEVRGFAMGVNYGTARIELAEPLRPGDRVRGAVDLVGVADVAGGLQTAMRITVELDGRAEPACVVEALSRWTPAQDLTAE